MPIFRPNSPGVYTSEKDLSLKRGGISRGRLGEAVNNNDEPPYTPPVIKPIFWILECGYWNDEGVWLDYAKWEDTPIC